MQEQRRRIVIIQIRGWKNTIPGCFVTRSIRVKENLSTQEKIRGKGIDMFYKGDRIRVTDCLYNVVLKLICFRMGSVANEGT